MTAAGLAAMAAVGVFWLHTSLALGWRGLGVGPRLSTTPPVHLRVRRWLVQVGLDEVSPSELVAALLIMGLLGAASGWVVFGGPGPAVMLGGFSVSAPLASFRQRRIQRLQRAREAWPAMIDEMRVLTGSLGRSVPQALFEVGRRAPEELQAAFGAAHREWLLTTDFARTTATLKQMLADSTTDMTCETLLVAHEIGGTDLDRRLEALADDRRTEVETRRDSRSRQAGARFARRFVLLVPAGMAAAGTSIGRGRAAYHEPAAQLVVLAAMAMIIACWLWAGRVMRLPEPERVFVR